MRVPPAVVNCQVLRELGRPWATGQRTRTRMRKRDEPARLGVVFYDPV